MTQSPIAQARRKAGLTQKELAEERGVTVSTVKRWESGFVAPHRSQMVALTERLGVSSDDVLAFVDRAQGRRQDTGDARTESAA